MKIRLDDVMQSVSCPFKASYYYYIPLETVLMFMNGVIYGKSIDGISSEKDILRQKEDFIKLPEIGEEGRIKVMKAFVGTIPGSDWFEELKDLDEDERMLYFENAVRERHLLIKWFNYRDEVYMEFSKRWCSENGLELIE